MKTSAGEDNKIPREGDSDATPLTKTPGAEGWGQQGNESGSHEEGISLPQVTGLRRWKATDNSSGLR